MKMRTENIAIIELPIVEIATLYKDIHKAMLDTSDILDLDKYPLLQAFLEGLYSIASYLIEGKVDNPKSTWTDKERIGSE